MLQSKIIHIENNQVQVEDSLYSYLYIGDDIAKANDIVSLFPIDCMLCDELASLLRVTHLFPCYAYDSTSNTFVLTDKNKEDEKYWRVRAWENQHFVSYGLVTHYMDENDVKKFSPILHFHQNPCMAHLLEHPSLFSFLLHTPVWITEKMRGKNICIQYDACEDSVECWDESGANVSYGWWLLGPNNIETVIPIHNTCFHYEILFPFFDAVKNIGVNRYGKAVDVFLRGFIHNNEVFFYEIILFGAQTFVLGAEQFLEICKNYNFPTPPTVGRAGETIANILSHSTYSSLYCVIPPSKNSETKKHEKHMYLFSNTITCNSEPLHRVVTKNNHHNSVSKSSESKQWRRSDPLVVTEKTENIEKKSYWTRKILDVANIFKHGIVIQIFKEKDFFEMVESSFTSFMKHKLGAQVLCDKELIFAKING